MGNGAGAQRPFSRPSSTLPTPQTILRVAEKREPGWTSRFRPVMNAQDTANNILVDLDGESQRDLLGNSGTAQLGLRRFISTTASMSSFFGPFGPGRRPALGRKQHAVLSSPQHVMKM